MPNGINKEIFKNVNKTQLNAQIQAMRQEIRTLRKRTAEVYEENGAVIFVDQAEVKANLAKMTVLKKRLDMLQKIKRSI